MPEAYRQLEVEQVGTVHCLRLRQARLESVGLEQLLDDFDRFANGTACTKVVLSLGPEDPQCLYSLLLAKLVSLQKKVEQHGGKLKIAEASADVQSIFEACRLRSLFDFVPDRETAIQQFG